MYELSLIKQYNLQNVDNFHQVFIDNSINRSNETDEPVPSSSNNQSPNYILNNIDSDEHNSSSLGSSVIINDSEEELFYKNQLVHPLLSCNKLEALQMVLMFFMRHNLTFVALEDLLKLINKILQFNSLPTTKYKFFKLFSKHKAKHVFFCKGCSNELELLDDFNDKTGTQILCQVCATNNYCSSNKSDNFFITLPIKERLEEIVSKKLEHLTNRTPPNNSNTISDITDGMLYKNLKSFGIRSNVHRLTLTLNTDGVQVLKSKSKSLWPVQATINELDPSERFLTKNIVLLGLWFHQSHPNMQILLKQLVLDLQKLKTDGLKVELNGQTYIFHVTLLCGSFDGPAKAAVQNLTQHNGYYSCHYCENRGEAVIISSAGTKQVRYLHKENCPKRNHKEAISNMKMACSNNNILPVKGNVRLFKFFIKKYINKKLLFIIRF